MTVQNIKNSTQLNTISEFLTINPVRVFDNIGITSLDYDADKEMFTLESSQFASKYEIKVALNNAKEFKENIDNVKFVIAYQRIIGVVVGNTLISIVTQLSYGKDFLCHDAVLFLGEDAVCNIESEGKPLRFTAPFAGSSMDGFSKNVATNLDAINTEVNSNRRINVRVLFKKSGQIDYLILSDNLSDKKLDYIHEQLYSVFTKYEFVPAKNKASIYQDIYETIEVSL